LIRAVVDPSVLVSAFIGDPAAGPGQLVEAWCDRRFALVVSPLLLAELDEVLLRPKFAVGQETEGARPTSPGLMLAASISRTPLIRRPRGFATLTTITSLR
jgi:hypothetical protein